MITSLIGFMGCGKSSVGKRLSELLCCRFMDLDTEIVERSGRSIPEIFETSGEKEFRRIEKETLEDVLRSCRNRVPGHPLILALGGGAVMMPECESLVHDKTMCIYLKASADTLLEHLAGETAGRPMLKGSGSVISSEAEKSALRERIITLMSLRAETYERIAHITIDTDGKSIDEIAKEILDYTQNNSFQE